MSLSSTAQTHLNKKYVFSIRDACMKPVFPNSYNTHVKADSLIRTKQIIHMEEQPFA